MLRSRFGYRTQIPNVTTQKARTKQVSFKGMVNTFKDNDDLDITELYAAIDARMVRRGRYKTRKGLDRYSVPVGEADNVTLTATTGATDAVVSGTGAVAQKLVTTGAGRATKAEVRIKAASGQAGVVIVELCEDSSGAPGSVLARSSIKATSIGTSYAYVPVYFLKAPLLTSSQTVWVVVRTQNARADTTTTTAGTFNVSTTSSVSTALLSATGGSTWSAQTYGVNVKLATTPDRPVLGMVRVNRPNGLNYTLFAAYDGTGASLYSVNETTGATTVVHSGMSASATDYQFEVIQDAVYWVNGFAQPYKWDFTTVTQDDDCPFFPDLIIEHVGLMFVARKDDTKIAWTNFGEYQTWTSTDFAYMLAPKTPFTITAQAKLNGALYEFAMRNKYQLLGEDNTSFSATEALSQRGTFSQQSLVYDDNAIYHADHEGVWMFNGTEEKELSESFREDYRAILDKDSIVLEKAKGRLYVFYPSNGSATNDQCYVINLDEGGKLESLDRNTPIARTYARKDKTGLFLQGSALVPAIYQAEADTNDYSNLGDVLEFELATAFNHFDAPGQYKRIPKFRPEFASVDGQYAVQIGFAKDFETTATWNDFDLTGSGARWDAFTWDDGTRYATGGNLQSTGILIPGTFRRLQRRYKHVAAREPVEFDSEVLELQTQRLR